MNARFPSTALTLVLLGAALAGGCATVPHDGPLTLATAQAEGKGGQADRLQGPCRDARGDAAPGALGSGRVALGARDLEGPVLARATDRERVFANF